MVDFIRNWNVDEYPDYGTDYDPYDNRKVELPVTNSETLMHLLKGSIGTGILAMPHAIKQSGLIVGPIGTVFCGLLILYTLHCLLRDLYRLAKINQVSTVLYSEGARLAIEMGPPCLRWSAGIWFHIVAVFLILWQLSICCVYIMFVADNISQIVVHNHSQTYPLWGYKVATVLIMTPICMIRNLKYLVPLSTVANILTFFGLLITFFYIIDKDIEMDKLSMAGTVSEYPLFVGTTLFALEAVGVIVALEHSMETPRDFLGFRGVLNQGFILILTMYVALGVGGYMQYGEEVLSSITLNLPAEDKKGQACKILYATALMMSYPLQAYPAYEIVWGELRAKVGEDKAVITHIFIKISFLVFTLLAAIAIPKLDLAISLAGALCLSVLGLIAPGVIMICVRYPDKYGRGSCIFWRGIVIIILGILAFVTGTYTSIHYIILEMNAENKD